MTETEKAALERRIDELCAEVERGKAEFKKMDVWHSQELKAAMDENAKLWELVSGLEHCSQGFACDCCPLYDPSGTNHRRCESLERELGIEVDE